jgi:lipopolysaccharide transport system ATP-binding protein
MKPVIHVENLSKVYDIDAAGRAGEGDLRESLVNLVKAPFHRLRNGSRPSLTKQEFWALKDVSFEVCPGEVVGIIGRNGAGKSTLLKILSRITEPTSGRAELRGRVSSLLEVGTGFHPDLTGRENIYLNGTILGMKKREIDRKFDEIVNFSGVEQFLDTPIKRYSSGMQVRLAFAVAAHLEPDILVVDEVLAVGDVAFQRKCHQQMDAAASKGQTVLYVSHNLPALQTLCERGLLLESGRIVADGPVAAMVDSYLKTLGRRSATNLCDRTDRTGTGAVRVSRVDISTNGHGNAQSALMGQPVRFLFEFDRQIPDLMCIFWIASASGQSLAKFNSTLSSEEDHLPRHGGPMLECVVDQLLLAPGRYRVDVELRADHEIQDRVEGAAFFDVIRGSVEERIPPHSLGDWLLCLPHRWSYL